MEIEIEVNRVLCIENWEVVKPFAIELLQKENRCSICGKPANPFVRIHGLNIREARIVVGLFHCPEHSSYYDVQEYQFVNGLMVLRKPDWKPVGKWFNVPYLDFEKIVYSRTQFGDAFPKNALGRGFVGIGNLCHKTVEIDTLPESYIVPPHEENSYAGKAIKINSNVETYTFGNRFHHMFRVPVEVYSNAEYADRLNNAKTLFEAEEIVRDFKGHPLKENEDVNARKEEPTKKNRWWQR